MRHTFLPRAALLASALIGVSCLPASAASVGVSTYHNDNFRTGWNPAETILTPQAVASKAFKRLHTVTLDEQVDAQPLVASNQKIGSKSVNVVYVATENNTVYAIKASDGTVLLQRNLGKAVSQGDLPGNCNNNATNVGIDSTPVIDPVAGRLYVIADTFSGGNAVFKLHVLSLTTLKDVVSAVTVSASGKLSDGSTYKFNGNVSRLRAAMLLSGGNVYAGFASYCDESADQSRGWVLGWNATTLAPLASNELTDNRATSEDNFFLSSIWMSGYGLAANAHGSVFFVTGNSDPSGTSFNRVENLAESALSVSGDLSTVNSVFTPGNWSTLDQEDGDFGSGGLMLLPDQGASHAKLAVAAGKDGRLFLLNAGNLNKHYATYDVGGCWCGQSYYTSSDGTGRVVTSGGNNVTIWSVDVSGTPKLTQISQSSEGVDDGQDPGFFTSISSNGTTDNSQVIWAVSRPLNSNPAHILLYAFDENANLLFSSKAGSWPNTGGNANIVPTVANGHVYVASNKTLAIFGLGKGAAAELPQTAALAVRPSLPAGMHEISGTIRAVDGSMITIQTRSGQTLKVDATDAIRHSNYAAPKVGRALMARGTYETGGVLRAEYVFHAKPSPAIWMADR
jgi:hypothetical protein